MECINITYNKIKFKFDTFKCILVNSLDDIVNDKNDMITVSVVYDSSIIMKNDYIDNIVLNNMEKGIISTNIDNIILSDMEKGIIPVEINDLDNVSNSIILKNNFVIDTETNILIQNIMNQAIDNAINNVCIYDTDNSTDTLNIITENCDIILSDDSSDSSSYIDDCYADEFFIVNV
jgi:hypothetical protein